MPNLLDRLIHRGLFIGATANQTRSTVAISGAFSLGSTGNAVALAFVAPKSTTLVDVYFYVTAVAGTGGTVQVQLRNYSNSFAPGATTHATATIATPTANRWYKATFGSPFSLTENTNYYVVLTSNDATNFATVISRSGPNFLDNYAAAGAIAVTTTGGFSSGSVLANGTYALGFGDGSVMGNPFTNTGTDTSNTRKRGIKLLGLDVPLTISGVVVPAGFGLMNAFKIYSGTTAPGGTTVLNQSLATANIDRGSLRFSPVTLAAATVYRLVFGYSGADTNPGYFLNEEDTNFPTVLDSVGFMGGQAIHTIDNGAGGWTDSTDRFPKIALMCSAFPAYGLLRHPGMGGGFSA